MRKIAVIQARMGSSRLPGKVLMDIGGAPMLSRVVERTRRASLIDEIVVATSTSSEDDAIANWARAAQVQIFRGNLHDVLDRMYQTARFYLADIVVRLTADCPLIDAGLIDRTIRGLQGEVQPQYEIVGRRQPVVSRLPKTSLPFDFAANRLPPPWKRTYPIGLDVEVCTFDALECAWENADQPYEREHVMPYLYQRPGTANVLLLHARQDYGHLRWTVDTPEDITLVREIFARFENANDFSWQDVLNLLLKEPDLAQINAHVAHKTVFDVDARRGQK